MEMSVKKTCLGLSSDQWRWRCHDHPNVKVLSVSNKSRIDGLSTKQKLKLLKSFADSSNKLSLEAAAAAFLNEVKAEVKVKVKVKKEKRIKSSESESGRNRIDVCMGNKCKKLGGESILGEFQRQISDPNAVVVAACKCMGKCKTAPNVRLSNSLHIGGVGLEDVTSIIFAASSQQHNNIFIS